MRQPQLTPSGQRKFLGGRRLWRASCGEEREEIVAGVEAVHPVLLGLRPSGGILGRELPEPPQVFEVRVLVEGVVEASDRDLGRVWVAATELCPRSSGPSAPWVARPRRST